MRTCRVRVEEKEEFLVYTVLWTLTCHPYLESATALSDDCIIIIRESRDGRSKSIGQYKLKTLLSLLPLLYRFSEGYSELLYLQRREENVQKPKIHSPT